MNPNLEQLARETAADRYLLQIRHAGEQSESDFVAANHHPSCKISDQDLMWVCAQCGLKVPAHASEQGAEQAIDLLTEVLNGHKDKESPDYNDCDSAPCQWCDDAARVIKLLSQRPTLATEGKNP